MIRIVFNIQAQSVSASLMKINRLRDRWILAMHRLIRGTLVEIACEDRDGGRAEDGDREQTAARATALLMPKTFVDPLHSST